MFSKFKKSDIILLCFTLSIPIFIFKVIKFVSEDAQNKSSSRPVYEWKKALKSVGFKGIVSDINDFDFVERSLYSIELKNITIENEKSIPINCDFFKYGKSNLTFAAYSQTVKRWPDYGLENGYIIEKKINNDTLFVYTSHNEPKYAFELFDGIVNEWVPRKWPKN